MLFIATGTAIADTNSTDLDTLIFDDSEIEWSFANGGPPGAVVEGEEFEVSVTGFTEDGEICLTEDVDLSTDDRLDCRTLSEDSEFEEYTFTVDVAADLDNDDSDIYVGVDDGRLGFDATTDVETVEVSAADIEGEVTEFDTPSGTLNQDDEAEIEITIRNTGQTRETVYYGTSLGPQTSGETYIQDSDTVTLDPGETETIWYSETVGENWVEDDYRAGVNLWKSSSRDDQLDTATEYGFSVEIIETEVSWDQRPPSEITLDESYRVDAVGSSHDSADVCLYEEDDWSDNEIGCSSNPGGDFAFFERFDHTDLEADPGESTELYWEVSNGDSDTTSEESVYIAEPEIEGEVTEFDTPSGTLNQDDEAAIEITIKNTGETRETLYYGTSVGPQTSGETYIEESNTVTLDPGDSDTVSYSGTVDLNWVEDDYRAGVNLWKSSSRDDQLDTVTETDFSIEVVDIEPELTIEEFDISASSSEHDTSGIGRTENTNASWASEDSGTAKTTVAARAGPVGATSSSKATALVGADWEASASDRVTVTTDSSLSGNIRVVPDDKPWYLPDVTDGYGARGTAQTSLLVYDNTEGELVTVEDSEVVDYRIPDEGEVAVSSLFTIGNALTKGVGGSVKEQIANEKGGVITEAGVEFAGDTVSEEVVGETASHVFESSYNEPIDRRESISVSFDAEEGHEYTIYQQVASGSSALGIAERASAAQIELDMELNTIYISDTEVDPPTVDTVDTPPNYVGDIEDAMTTVSAEAPGSDDSVEIEYRLTSPDGTTTEWDTTFGDYFGVHPGEIFDSTPEGEYILQFRAVDTRTNKTSEITSTSTVLVESAPSIELSVTEETESGAVIYSSVDSVATVEEVVIEYKSGDSWTEWKRTLPEERVQFEESGETEIRAQAVDVRGEDSSWETVRVDVPGQIDGVPKAQAGDNRTVRVGDTVTLDATSSTHSDEEDLSYDWTQVSGPDVAVSDERVTLFDAPDVSVATTLTFVLTVTDEAGTSDSEEVDVVIVPEETSEDPASFEVEITDIPTLVQEGDDLTAAVDVENTGGERDEQTIELLDLEGNVVDSVSLELDSGSDTATTLMWNTSAGDVGKGTIQVASDNDSDGTTIEVVEPTGPDVDILHTNDPVEPGETLEVTAVIENASDTFDNQEVSLGIDDTEVDAETVDLEGGDDETITLEWETGQNDAGTYVAELSTDDDTVTETVSVTAAAETTGHVVGLDHDTHVLADGEFAITVETANASSTFLQVKPDNFDVELSSEESVAIQDNLVQIDNHDTNESRYTIEADIIGGTAGDTADIAAWVDAEQRADADDEMTSTLTLDDEHPSGVQLIVWEAVTDQNDAPDELTFQDLVDAIHAYQTNEPVNGVELNFQDLIDLIEWYQG